MCPEPNKTTESFGVTHKTLSVQYSAEEPNYRYLLLFHSHLHSLFSAQSIPVLDIRGD